MRRFTRLAALSAALVLCGSLARAGVVNPDISVVGQPFARWTDNAADDAGKRPTLHVGETEFVFDAYLNPYARGTFVVAFHDEHVHVEEGYFNLLRGLPGGLALKGGKYRVGFGKLNPVHPHAYPFAERFHVLATYLPGHEAFVETGVQLSTRLPAPGDVSLTAAADWLQGDSFRHAHEEHEDHENHAHEAADETRPAALGRLSAFVPIGDRSGLELGLSAAGGTNHVGAGARSAVLGADFRLKLWNARRSNLVLQGELLHLERDEASWDDIAEEFTVCRVTPTGGYLFANLDWEARYNFGVSYERWQQPTAEEAWDQAFGLFAGLALMEETTAFRIGWEHLRRAATGGMSEPDPVNTLTLRVIYSMGPHKAHQF
jgi:hypothetical protein